MNYVKHLNQVFQAFSADDRLNPNHISLYLSLFQEWNSYMFAKRTFIFRGELMKKSKIRSKTTYHRCMRDLNKWGYIIYHPSKDAFKGSMVEMKNPEKMISHIKKSNDIGANRVSAGRFQAEDEFSKEDAEAENLNCPRSRKNQISVHSRSENDHDMVDLCSEDDRKMAHRCPEDDQNLIPNINTIKPKKTKKRNKPGSEKEVIDFFKSKKWQAMEGKKFFHHYQSIGWKKGGITPLTDWRAAAESWVLRGMELKSSEIPPVRMRNQDNLKTTRAKHYDKPL